MCTTRPTLLIAFQTIEEAYALFEERFHIIRPPLGRDFSRDELLEHLPHCDALCGVFDIPIDRELIEAGAPRLKLISNYAVGFNNIDLEAARAAKVAVTNTPKSVVVPTAELVMALLLAATRRVAELDARMRSEGHALKMSRIDFLGTDLDGKSIGLVGFGNIGKAVAQRCRAFGMKVFYNKRNRLTPQQEEELGIHYMEVDDIFKTCDVVSLHTPLTPETRHLANKQRIGMMKKEAILINTARGPVVDECALVDALQHGRLHAAALDVFENNDLPNEALYKLSNVVMTPHVGTQTFDARYKMALELRENVEGFFFNNGVGAHYIVPPFTESQQP